MARNQRRAMSIKFPLQGLDDRWGIEQQPPYTTPECQNVFPIGPLEKRARGGSRPCLRRSYDKPIGDSETPGPIRLLNQVTIASRDGFTYWSDLFTGSRLDPVWSIPVFQERLPRIFPEMPSTFVYEEEAGAVRDALPINTDYGYSVGLYLYPYKEEWAGEYSLYVRYPDASPGIQRQSGIRITLSMTGKTGEYTCTMQIYADDGQAVGYRYTRTGTAEVKPGWFRVYVDPMHDNKVISVYWAGRELFSHDFTTDLFLLVKWDIRHGEHRVGFGLKATVPGGVCVVSEFQVRYTTTNVRGGYRQVLVASADHQVWTDDNVHGTMQKIIDGTGVNLADDRPLKSVQRGQKLYIADWEEDRISGSGTLTAKGTILSDAAITADIAGTIDKNNDVVVISNGTGTLDNGTYKISSVTTGSVTLDGTGAGANGSCDYRIARAPKIFDPVAGTLKIWTAEKGQVPTGCKLIERYRDRLVLAGDDADPHLYYASRQGDPLDWDFGQTDSQRAFGGESSPAGVVGQPITGLQAHSDDQLVIGMVGGTSVMRGDPAASGVIDQLDTVVGPICGNAICKGPGGTLLMLTWNGLHIMAAGDATPPSSLSENRIPNELKGITEDMRDPFVIYDPRLNAIHCYLTPKNADRPNHWWYEMALGGWWPIRLHPDHEPTAVHLYEGDIRGTRLLLGCRDGYIREFHELANTDDGKPVLSIIALGPFKTDDYSRQILLDMTATMAERSGRVRWEVSVGDSPEEALEADAQWQGQWYAGANTTDSPGAGGAACAIRILGGCNLLVEQDGSCIVTQDGDYIALEDWEGYGPWAMENILLVIERRGRRQIET